MREPIHSLSSPPSCGTGHCLGTFKKDHFSSWVCSSDSTQLISRDLPTEKNLFFVGNIHKVTVFRMLPKVPPGFIHTGRILATSQRKGVPIPRQWLLVLLARGCEIRGNCRWLISISTHFRTCPPQFNHSHYRQVSDTSHFKDPQMILKWPWATMRIRPSPDPDSTVVWSPKSVERPWNRLWTPLRMLWHSSNWSAQSTVHSTGPDMSCIKWTNSEPCMRGPVSHLKVVFLNLWVERPFHRGVT